MSWRKNIFGTIIQSGEIMKNFRKASQSKEKVMPDLWTSILWRCCNNDRRSIDSNGCFWADSESQRPRYRDKVVYRAWQCSTCLQVFRDVLEKLFPCPSHSIFWKNYSFRRPLILFGGITRLACSSGLKNLLLFIYYFYVLLFLLSGSFVGCLERSFYTGLCRRKYGEISKRWTIN